MCRRRGDRFVFEIEGSKDLRGGRGVGRSLPGGGGGSE